MPRIKKKTIKKKDGKIVNIINIQTGRSRGRTQQVQQKGPSQTALLTSALLAQQKQREPVNQDLYSGIREIGFNVKRLLEQKPTMLASMTRPVTQVMETQTEQEPRKLQMTTPSITGYTSLPQAKLSMTTQTLPQAKLSMATQTLPQAKLSMTTQTLPQAKLSMTTQTLPIAQALPKKAILQLMPTVVVEEQQKKERIYKDPVKQRIKSVNENYNERIKIAKEQGDKKEATRLKKELDEIKKELRQKYLKQQKEEQEYEDEYEDIEDTSVIPAVRKEHDDVEFTYSPSDVTTSEAFKTVNETQPEIIQEPLQQTMSLGSGSGLNPSVSLMGSVKPKQKTNIIPPPKLSKVSKKHH